jgi:hypothetical protein
MSPALPRSFWQAFEVIKDHHPEDYERTTL